MRLALIPARACSKRMSKKNVTPFCGKPIIKDVLKATFHLLNASLFNLVCADEHLIIPIGWLKL